MYQVSKIQREDEAADPEITCLECGAPFPAREGRFLLKYLMLRKATRLRKGRPSAAQRAKSRTPRSSRR
jgi:hypothetical protein